MNIWIISEGEKAGPYADYEVRKMIAEGKCKEDTVGWHDGCAEWMPLSRMSLFEREFDQPEVVDSSAAVPPPLSGSVRGGGACDGWAPGVYWMRRFWARGLDLQLFAGLFWIGLYVVGVDVGAVLRNLWLMLLLYLPWVPIEAYLIARFGTTPGKWLAGLRVVRPGGGVSDFANSLRRSLQVYFLGIGMGWGVVSLICMCISLVTVRAAGRAVWDRDGYHVVEGLRWTKRRGLVLILAYFLVSQLQLMVLAPHIIEHMKQYPEWRELMEKSSPEHQSGKQ